MLRRAEEETPVYEVCRKTDIVEARIYKRSKKYGGLTPSAKERLKKLEPENGKLKKIVADQSHENIMLKEVIKRKPKALALENEQTDIK